MGRVHLLGACVVAVVCCAAAADTGPFLRRGRGPWGEEEVGQQLVNSSKSHSSWICHLNKDYQQGDGGVVKKNKCSSACNATSDHHKDYLGYIGAIVAVLCFGSNFVPVKKYETGDGVFYQWVLCVGIWLVGLVVNFIMDSPILFLPSVIGGFFWTTGNMLVVPIIKMIGLTMGLTVWGVTNMLSGWVIGRFILNEPVSCSGLNYGGVGMVVISVTILAFVKSDGKVAAAPQNAGGNATENSALLGAGERTDSLEGSLRDRVLQKPERVTVSPPSINSGKVTFSSSSPVPVLMGSEDGDGSWVDKLGVWHKRLAGFGLSLIAGLVFSFLFLPVQFLKICDDSAHSCSDLDYLFGVYSGILFTSTFYFFVYSAIRGNKPRIYPKLIFPGIISGLLWGIAMAGWFLANQYLSLAISFPLVTAGPGFVSSVWGILVYREIRGWRNIMLFFATFLVSLTGLILNGLSRCAVNC